ncbi:hypothetical protein HY357_03165 [Candidatus Roizmanbacteria bacterium]|nr:hypothetical protein [Candidatus Roizmanbacteria bacterium]
MKAKFIILTIGIIIVLAIALIVISSDKGSKLTSPLSNNPFLSLSPTVKPTTKKYSDPSGFKFSYQDGLKIERIDKKNPDYYSSLKATTKDSVGSITIDVTSTKYKSLDEWVKNNRLLAKNVKEIKLADLEALEIDESGKYMILAIDTETLFTIVATFNKSDEKYWKKATNTVVSTFALELPETSINNGQSSDEDIVFEGEETVE